MIDIVPYQFYVATNSDQCPDGEFAFWVNVRQGVKVAWGFSVWRGRPGYRTLGLDLAGWLARPANAAIVIREDRDRRLDKRTRKPKPVDPRRYVTPPDPRDAEITALRAQVEELRVGAASWHKAYAQGRRDERAEVVTWLDGDLPVDLDAYTVMRVRVAIEEGDHVPVAADAGRVDRGEG